MTSHVAPSHVSTIHLSGSDCGCCDTSVVHVGGGTQSASDEWLTCGGDGSALRLAETGSARDASLVSSIELLQPSRARTKTPETTQAYDARMELRDMRLAGNDMRLSRDGNPAHPAQRRLDRLAYLV